MKKLPWFALPIAVLTLVESEARGGTPAENGNGGIQIITPPEKDFFSKILDFLGISIKAPQIEVDDALFAASHRHPPEDQDEINPVITPPAARQEPKK